MITCEPSASVMVAPARSAMDRTTSVPAALSGDASTVHDGSDFQAGGPDGSVKASSSTSTFDQTFNDVIKTAAAAVTARAG